MEEPELFASIRFAKFFENHLSCDEQLTFEVKNRLEKLDLSLITTLETQYLTGLKSNEAPGIIAIAGSQGSGKTTFAQEKFSDYNNYYRFDLDKILLALSEYQADLKKAKATDERLDTVFIKWYPVARFIADCMCEFAISKNYNIIYDRTCSLEDTFFMLHNARKQGYYIALYGLYTTKEIAQQRVVQRARDNPDQYPTLPKDKVRKGHHDFASLWRYYLTFVNEAFLHENSTKVPRLIFELTENGENEISPNDYVVFLNAAYDEKNFQNHFPNMSIDMLNATEKNLPINS